MARSGAAHEEFMIQDVRRLRRVLGSRLLLDASLRSTFLQELEKRVADPEVLRSLLLPLVPENQVM